jgi:hypothetical protein
MRAFMTRNMEVYGDAASKLHAWCKAHPIDARFLDRPSAGRVDGAGGAEPGIPRDSEASWVARHVVRSGSGCVAVLDRASHDSARLRKSRTHREMKRRLAKLEQETL